MRKIIAIEFVSLDGVMQSPGSKDEDISDNFDLGGWITNYNDEIISNIIKNEMDLSFDLLLGKTTFEIWANYWPSHLDYWTKLKEANKYVISTTISDHIWQPVNFINNKDLKNKIIEIKKTDGNNLHLYGSSQLFNTLMEYEVIDEIWLKTYPIILGKGKKLFFNQNKKQNIKLLNSTIGSSGIISSKYLVQKSN